MHHGGDSSTRTVWLGQEFVDEDTQRHVRRVVLAAAVMAIVTTAAQVVAVMGGIAKGHLGLGSLRSALMHLVAGLVLPACGFFGATRSNAGMMCCFCGSTLALALFYALMLVVLVAALGQTDAAIQATCNASCRVLGCGFASESCSCDLKDCVHRRDKVCCSDFEEVCPLTRERPQLHLSCEDLQGTLATANIIVVAVLLVLIAPGIGLSAYAWYHGMMLWRRLAAGERLTASGAVVLSRAPHPQEEEVGDSGSSAPLTAAE